MREMKDSGVPWLGSVPSHWKRGKLKQYIFEVSEKNSPVQTTDILSLTNRLGVVPYEEKGNQGNTAKEKYDEYKLAYPDTIVANSMNILIGSVGYCSYFGCVSPVYYVFKNFKNGNLKYINYIFQTTEFQKCLRQFSNGILEIRQRVSAKTILNQDFFFPNLDEQNAIAEYLDTKCDQIDTIIVKEQSVIEKLQEYKQAIITQAITRGLNPSTKMKKTGLKWMGMVLEHWDVKKIKYLTSKIGSGKTPKGGSDVYIDEGVLFIRSQNVYDGYFDLSSVAFISHEIDSTMSNTRVYRNDVLLNITGGSIGRSCLYESDEPANVNQHVCIIRCNNQMRPKFMQYFWNSRIGKISIDIYQSGANREGLNFTEIGNTLVPTPELHEQDQIIDYLDGKCDVINNVIQQKHSLINKLTEYKKSLIYEVVTGKKEVPHV